MTGQTGQPFENQGGILEWDRCNRCLEGTAYLPCVSYAKHGIMYGLDCPTVRPSFMLWYILKNRHTIMRFPPYDSPIILVLGNVNIVAKFQGGHPQRGRWMEVGIWKLVIFGRLHGQYLVVSRKWLKIDGYKQRGECWAWRELSNANDVKVGVFCPRGVPPKIHTMHLLQLLYNFRCTDARSQRQLCFLLRDTWTRTLALAHLVCLSSRTVSRTILSRHDCPVF